jgi:putative PEP-CTERM system TPR-repeat lipoprotein
MRLARAGRFGVLLLALAGVLAGCGALVPTEHRIASARKDMQAGNWRSAAIELRTVVQAHPENAEAWLLLTRLSLDAGIPADAPADLTHALASGAKGPEVDALRVRTWLETRQPKKVIDALASHTVTLSGTERALALAQAYLALGKPDEALRQLQPLIEAHPDLTQALVLKAQALAGEGQLDASLQQLQTAIRQDPKAPEPLRIEGGILAARGQYAAAESALSQSLALMPAAEPALHRVTALVTLAQARLAQGKIDAAAQSIAGLQQLAPTAPVTEALDARIKLAHGQLSDGIDELERVVADAPGYAEARLLLGGALLSRGDLEQAQEQLDQVLQEAPDNLEARRLLAEVRLKLNEPQAALTALTPALGGQTIDSQTLSLLGEVASQVGQSQAVLDALMRSQRAHPDNEVLRLNLAQMYLTADEPDRALALLAKTTDDDNPRRDQLLVAALFAAKGPPAAGAEVTKLLAARPRDPAVLQLGAAYYASQGALDRARTLLSEELRLNPRDVTATASLARIEAAAGDTTAAEDTLKSALAADPTAWPIRVALAQRLAGAKEYAQAESVLQGADEAKVGAALPFALASVYLAQGDQKQANAALDRAIALQPGQAGPVEDAGLLLLQARQYDAALARFAQATVIAPDNAVYWFNTARAQLALNQPLAARGSLQKAAQLRPNWLPVVGTLALMDLRDHRGQSALDRVNALLSSEPDNADALTLKGDVQVATGDLAGAKATYGQAQRQRPNAAVAVKLFQLAIDAHEAQPAKALEQWLARQPNDWRVRAVLGNYYLSTGQFRPAAQAFQAVVRLAPENVMALNNLAWAENKLHDPGAEAIAERAHQLAPQTPAVDDTLGWILAHRGETARAVSLLAQAASQSPDDPDVQYHYAYALVQDGRRSEAQQILTKLLAAHPKFDSQHEAERLLASTRT